MDDTRIINVAGRRWSIRPAAEPALADGWPPDRPEWLKLVKPGHRRAVYRFEVAGVGYYVKRYDRPSLWGRIAAALGLSPARREWQALLAAREAGLAAPEPVALALDSREAIVTREIPGAQRLDEYLFERYFEPLPGDPPYPGARPPELVSVFRRRREPPAGTITPSELARALADLILGLIRAGLALTDFHPGNILISGGPGKPGGPGEPSVPDSPWRLSLVDLAASELDAGPDEVGFPCLYQLEHFFEPIASVTERLRCLAHLEKGLAAGGGKPAWTLRDARHLARVTARYRQTFYHSRDRRLRRQSKYFRRVTADHWRGRATGDWADAIESWLRTAVERAASSPAATGPRGSLGDLAALFGKDATVLKAGGTSTVIRTRLAAPPKAPPAPEPTPKSTPPQRKSPLGKFPARKTAPADKAAAAPAAPPTDGSDRWIIVKRHHRNDLRGVARAILHRSRALTAFRKGHALLARGIATDRPAGAIDLTLHGRVRDSLLMTEAVDDALPLAAWIRRNPAPAVRRRVTWRLARLIRRLHDAGFAHRDLKAPNILITGARGPDPRPVLVDLDGVRRAWRISAHRRAQNLMRLSVSLDEWKVARQTDRLRFLRAYLGRRGCPAAITILHRHRGSVKAAHRLRRWWRRIARLSLRKMQALRRKGTLQ